MIVSDVVQCTATLSQCGKYRYRLSRNWDLKLPVLVWVMLNPSTADAEFDDPTIGRCVSFAKEAGYGGIIVVNLFAFRATDPKDLFKAVDPEGPGNDDFLRSNALNNDCVVAWGANAKKYQERADKVTDIIRTHADDVICLGKTKTGQPRHPLMVRKDVEWETWK